MGNLTEHFSLSEFACKCGCGFRSPHFLLVQRLESARRRVGFPIVINSGCRCPAWNEKWGGIEDSAHLSGQAVDVRCLDSTTRFRLVEAFVEVGFRRIKLYESWIHLDVDDKKPEPVLVV